MGGTRLVGLEEGGLELGTLVSLEEIKEDVSVLVGVGRFLFTF
jgi:hypothetical protein